MEPVSIIALVAAVISAINAGMQIMSKLWKKLKTSFGSTLRSQSALQMIDHGDLSSALTTIFQQDRGLRNEAGTRYIKIKDKDFSDWSDW